MQQKKQPIVLAKVVAVATAVAMPFCGYAVYMDNPYLSGLGVVVALALMGLCLSMSLLFLADLVSRNQ